jgi:hypothetical protein
MGRTVRIDIYKDTLKTPRDLLWQKRFIKKTICGSTGNSAGN